MPLVDGEWASTHSAPVGIGAGLSVPLANGRRFMNASLNWRSQAMSLKPS
ncbi:hypothetical protein LV79_003776 [Actinokineospora globicatena]|nr:hypothetical protein [Actinokineospora globicatena]